MTSRIHLDLISLDVPKQKIDETVFKAYKLAEEKGIKPPYLFTACSPKDPIYRNVLKDNNVFILESKNKEIKECAMVVKSLSEVGISNIPIFENVNRACIYVDWDNVQVPSSEIEHIFSKMRKFIQSNKIHKNYMTYVFVNDKTKDDVKKCISEIGGRLVLTSKGKTSGDEEIIRFIEHNTAPLDTICVVSGDRDFSAMMVKMVHKKHNVFLVYNRQANPLFKNNVHWISSANIDSFKRTASMKKCKIKHLNIKPCKFFNLSSCKESKCGFLHVCGVCGRNHKSSIFHPGVKTLKSIICKKYNTVGCMFGGIECGYLHICMKCKKSHSYLECSFNSLKCPLCVENFADMREYILHVLGTKHTKKIRVLKRILYPKLKPYVL